MAGQTDLTASITTTSADVILAGSTVQLTGSVTGTPTGSEVFYRWRFAKTPFFSAASFSTPAPTMPSFIADREGLYVIELTVLTADKASEPQYRLISVVTASGTAALASQAVSTPLLCALSDGYTGCTATNRSFTATPGNYSLNIVNNSASDLRIILNNQKLAFPSNLDSNAKFSIHVNLLEQNLLEIALKGGMGSSIEFAIIGKTQPSKINSAPQVASLFLSAANSNRHATGNLVISDINSDQSHTSRLLQIAQYGSVSLIGSRFQYTGFSGFKGREKIYILTYDNGSPQKGVISTAQVSVTYNEAPTLPPQQKIHVPVDSLNFTFELSRGEDLERDDMTYSIVTQPSSGMLSCSDHNDSFSCRYSLPNNFRTAISFTYRVSDGQVNSGIATVELRPFYVNSFATKLSAGSFNSCAVFNQGNVRCWGLNSGNEIPGLTGDNEDPIIAGDMNFESSEVIKTSIGDYFMCALLKSGQVRCWGNNFLGQLGLGDRNLRSSPSESQNIDFGTSLKVINITSGEQHSCALFESGQVKCWGANQYGQLGLGHTQFMGDNETIHNVNFLDLGARVNGIEAGYRHLCALLEGGMVRCWGNNTFGQLGLGHTNRIGDDEVPSSQPFVSLGGVATQLALGHGINFALLANGQIMAWGWNHRGRLGLGHSNNIGDNELPSSQNPLSLGGAVTSISSGGYRSCVILGSKNIRCWQSGIPSANPVEPFSEKIIDTALGDQHTCVLMISGRINCWGNNRYAQLGLGHNRDIYDKNNLQNPNPVKVGGTSVDLYPRFSFAPGDTIVSTAVQFDASNSFAKMGISSYAWDFGNGITATGASASHTFTTAGDYSVTLTLTDTIGGTSSVEKIVRVRLSNHQPFIAKNQVFTVEEGETLDFTLAGGEDWENNPLTYAVVDAPGQGTLTGCLDEDADLSCSYISPVGFTGEVTFTYKANDGTSDSMNNAQITINVTLSE